MLSQQPTHAYTHERGEETPPHRAHRVVVLGVCVVNKVPHTTTISAPCCTTHSPRLRIKNTTDGKRRKNRGVVLRGLLALVIFIIIHTLSSKHTRHSHGTHTGE